MKTMTKAEYATSIYRIMYQNLNLGFDEVIKDNPSLFACTVSYFNHATDEVPKIVPWDARRYTFDDGSSVTDDTFRSTQTATAA